MTRTSESAWTVAVVGAGIIGKQIALQVALQGFRTIVHDADRRVLDRFEEDAREYPERILKERWYLFRGPQDQLARLQSAAARMTFDDRIEAVADCNLVIEAVPEIAKIKQDLFSQLNARCPADVLFATNTSSISPSDLAESTGRADRFGGLHFSLGNQMVEVMPHAGCSAETFETLVWFAELVARPLIVCRRESRGGALNPMIMSLNGSALDLALEGVADPVDLDRAFMKSFGAKIGPFGSLDAIGLDLAMAINEVMYETESDLKYRRRAEYLRQHVERGRLGLKSGIGFYRYPGAAFQQPGFADGRV